MNLNNLLPDELKRMQKQIEQLLKELGVKKETNQKYQIKNRTKICPYCKVTRIIKYGHKNGTQRYQCTNCKKVFSINHDSVIYHSKLDYNQLSKILQDIIDGKTLEIMASNTKLSKHEIYIIKSKIMDTLNNLEQGVKLKGVIQADEKYVRLSFKGTRKGKMPRKSRKNGFQERTSGISKEQVCVIVAIDSNDNMIIKLAGLGPATTEMIEYALGNNIEEGSILVTDSKSAYRKFAKNHKLDLKQIPHGKYKIEEYHLGELNSLMSEIEMYILNARGLSTRHLQDNLNLIKYKKLLKYTVEYIEQYEKFMNYSLVQTTKLRARNVCKTKLPIDITELYGCNFK